MDTDRIRESAPACRTRLPGGGAGRVCRRNLLDADRGADRQRVRLARGPSDPGGEHHRRFPVRRRPSSARLCTSRRSAAGWAAGSSATTESHGASASGSCAGGDGLLRRHARLFGVVQPARHRPAAQRSRGEDQHLGGDLHRAVRLCGGADGRGVLLPRLPVRHAAPHACDGRRPRARTVGGSGDRWPVVRPRALRFGSAGVPDPARLSRLRALHRALADRLALPLHGAALDQQLDRVGANEHSAGAPGRSSR